VIRIGNHRIDEPIERILNDVKSELTNGKLGSIRIRGGSAMVTCPCHSDGREDTPSCSVSEEGLWHCFACHEGGTLPSLIGHCFDSDEAFGKRWLLGHYVGEEILEDDPNDFLPEDLFDEPKTEFLDESCLDGLEPWHPYLEKRHLSRKVCEFFKVGYDPNTRMVVFPTWDDHGRLYMLTRRSVDSKRFIIDKGKEKPVYLLNYIKKKGITEVTVCESQINCLTCYGFGYPAIAMFGTGTKYQYDALNRSGIRHYYLAFDGDEAGRKATARFIQNIHADAFIDVIEMPEGKDVNDLTQEEFDSLPTVNCVEWLEKNGL